MMQTFPLFLSLQGRRALIVGGGEAAARKAELLLKAGAQVSPIASTVGGEIAQFIAEGHISWAGCTFDDNELEGVSLVIVASEDEVGTGARVGRRAETLPAGQCRRPARALELHHAGDHRSRADHHRHLDGRHGHAGAGAPSAPRSSAPCPRRWAGWRASPRSSASRCAARWSCRAHVAASGTASSKVGSASWPWRGDEISARRELIRLLDGFRSETPSAGMVHLVGAGPGDPDLLTLKAHRLLQRADVVVYDDGWSRTRSCRWRDETPSASMSASAGRTIACPQQEINDLAGRRWPAPAKVSCA